VEVLGRGWSLGGGLSCTIDILGRLSMQYDSIDACDTVFDEIAIVCRLGRAGW
jgi:hypothetical protein